MKLRLFFACVFICIILLLFRIRIACSCLCKEDIYSNTDLKILSNFIGDAEYIGWISLNQKSIHYNYGSDFYWVETQFWIAPALLDNNIGHNKLICFFTDFSDLKAFMGKTGYKIVHTLENKQVVLLSKCYDY